MALVSWLCSPPTADLQNVLRKRTFLVTKTTHADILSHKELSQFDIWAKLWGSILGNILVHFEQRRLSSSYDDEQFHNWFFYPFPPAFFSLTQVLLQQKYFCWSKYLSMLGKVILWKLLLHSEGEREAWQQPIFFLMRGYSWLKLSVYQCSEMVCVTTASDVKGVSTWKYNPCARTQCLTFQAANSWKMLCKHFNKTILIPGYYYCSHLRFYAIHLSWVSWKQWAHVYVFVDRQWEAPTLLAVLPFEVLLQDDIWIENPVFFLQRNLSFLKQVSPRVGEILVKLF